MVQVKQPIKWLLRRHAVSKYGKTQTVLREEKYLVDALKEMGYEVEVHPEGVQLNVYYSEQFIDEIEKAFAGTGTGRSGVKTEAQPAHESSCGKIAARFSPMNASL